MSLHCTETSIASDVIGCGTFAHYTDGLWWVTGYPGRAMCRGEAVAAMRLAEVAADPPPPGDPLWERAADWRHLLGLDPHPTIGEGAESCR